MLPRPVRLDSTSSSTTDGGGGARVRFLPARAVAPSTRAPAMASPSLLDSALSPTASAVDRRLQLVRALSCDLRAPKTNSPQNSSGHSRGSPRMPLFPLPPPLQSPIGSSFDECSDDGDSPHSAARRSIKRVRSFHSAGRGSSLLARSGSFHGALSPFASRTRTELSAPPPLDISDAPATSAHSSAFRPPPIRTMGSLEGWGGVEDGRASAASMRSAGSSNDIVNLGSYVPPMRATADVLNPPSIIAPPPTPSSRPPRRGFSGATSMTGLRAGATEPPMSLVAPGLYVGDEASAASVPALLAAGVTHILNCSALPSAIEGHPNAAHIQYRQLGLYDNTSDLPRMQEALITGVDFITQAHANGGTVLVHCHRGISRSATLAIAYLVRATQQPAEKVFELVKQKRLCIDPNLSYMIALKTWERRVLPPSVLRARSSFSPSLRPHESPPTVRPLSRAG